MLLPAFPVCGFLVEAFSLPAAGLPGLVREGNGVRFALETDMEVEDRRYRYRIELELRLASSHLGVADEYLAQLTKSGNPRHAAIGRMDGRVRICRKGKGARPMEEEVGVNHSILSDCSRAGSGYEWLDEVRAELAGWRIHYLEPRMAMRGPSRAPPM